MASHWLMAFRRKVLEMQTEMAVINEAHTAVVKSFAPRVKYLLLVRFLSALLNMIVFPVLFLTKSPEAF